MIKKISLERYCIFFTKNGILGLNDTFSEKEIMNDEVRFDIQEEFILFINNRAINVYLKLIN